MFGKKNMRNIHTIWLILYMEFLVTLEHKQVNKQINGVESKTTERREIINPLNCQCSEVM